MPKKVRKKIYRVWSRDLEKTIKVKSQVSAQKIAEEGNPEYIVNCPRCDCKFGVN